MKFKQLGLPLAIVTILCGTSAEALHQCPPAGCPAPTPPQLPPIQVAITTCNCANEAALMTAAGTYLSQWMYLTPSGYTGFINGDNSPNAGVGSVGTRLLVISTSVPISGVYYYSYNGTVATLLSANAATDAGAVATDEAILARSVKMTPITLGPGQIIQGVDPIDSISGWLQGRFAYTAVGTSFWHAILTLNLAQVSYATIRDISGQTFTVYSGETITVYDAKGWSMQLTYNPLAGSIPWQVKPDSARDDKGNKVNMVNNVPTTPIPSTGSPMLAAAISAAAGTTWNPVTAIPYRDTLPQGTIIVEGFLPSNGGSIHTLPNDSN
jgi:hypothetical protein